MSVIGVDEVGYGCWAGPVVVCALKASSDLPSSFVDSKQLSEKAREKLFLQILDLHSRGIVDLVVSFGSVVDIIEKGVLTTTLACMKKAIKALSDGQSKVFIDGRNAPKDLFVSYETLVDGDKKMPVISAASIFAKVYRDAYMQSLSLLHPTFSWEKNKGYGTLAHRRAIDTYGVTKHHRVSYKPLRKFAQNLEIIDK